jgi:hypothetical protein
VIHWLACVNAMVYFQSCASGDCPEDSWWAYNALDDAHAGRQYMFAIVRAFAQILMLG